MVVETVNFPFLHETSLEEYIKTLHRIDQFGAIQCDQASREDYKIYNACKYARELIQKELDELKEQKKLMYEDLDKKYGVRGVDYFVTMAGSVHVNKRSD